MLIVMGIRRLNASREQLWAQYERGLRSRGLPPVRDSAWESHVRSGAWISLVAGGLMLVVALLLAGSMPSPPEEMSGVEINGRQLTEQEWEACGKEVAGCTSRYAR